MRRNRLAALCLAALLLLLGGCSGRSGADLDIDAAAATILAEVEFQNQLIQATGDAVRSYYILSDAVADHAIFIDGSGGSAEEVAVLAAVDESSVGAVQAVVEDRLYAQTLRFQDYEPGQMVKINDPVIVTRGRYVIMVLCDDPSAAQAVVEGLFA